MGEIVNTLFYRVADKDHGINLGLSSFAANMAENFMNLGQPAKTCDLTHHSSESIGGRDPRSGFALIKPAVEDELNR